MSQKEAQILAQEQQLKRGVITEHYTPMPKGAFEDCNRIMQETLNMLSTNTTPNTTTTETPTAPTTPAPSPVVQTISEARPMDQVIDLIKNTSGMTRAAHYAENRNRLMPILNSNTIDAGLKRAAILQEVVSAFATRLLPLRAFSTVFNGVRLEGTDVVTVPYFSLSSTASTDFDADKGYEMGDNTWGKKSVTVNKRKYQPLRLTSAELNRTPFLNMTSMLQVLVDKLATDVLTDVLSVVTLANYGAAGFTGAASDFDNADVGTLRGLANAANWPQNKRSLILDSTYESSIALANIDASAYGGSEAIRNGGIPKLLGFDVYESGVIPANSEYLKGFICAPSAVLFAMAPIPPAEEISCRHEVISDAQTGISFEFRSWGNPDMDQTRQVVEANYGYAVGEAAALKRIVSQ